jgi:hypothetical protein
MPKKESTKKKSGAKKATKSRRQPASKPRATTKRQPASGKEAMAKVVSVVKSRGDELRSISGVYAYNVRPGYLFKDNHITSKPAVVVVIDPRDRARKSLIPNKLDGVPVQVKMATPAEQLRRHAPEADIPGAVDAESDLALPGWDMMRGDADEDVESDPSFDEQDASKLVEYVPPDGVKLLKVNEVMKVTCHVSPEEGWKQLSEFLSKARTKRLTMAMYDFTAPHVLEKLADRASGNAKLSLILDPGVSKNGQVKAKDVWEEEVRDTLAGKLDQRFAFLWAAVKRKGKVTKGIFPTSYHIKVAVSGGKSFWLSSGNLQSSNQPDVDALNLSLAKLHSRYNREWHVIVEHDGLASTYEKFILQDIKQAKPLQVQPQGDEVEADELAAELAPELLVPAVFLDESEHVERQKFPATTFPLAGDKPIRVHQVLTPDNFAKAVAPVIRAAKKKLYFQNQYIKISENVGEEFTDLLDALLTKVADGIEDVRIILRELPHASDELEALQYYAWENFGIDDLSFIKYQPGCHTKGIILDSKVVVVGSHNWSNPGVSKNRDATLIFFNSDIAQYYEKVFLHDFAVLAKPKVLSDEEMPIVIRPTESDEIAADPGLETVPWDFFEDAD